MRGYRSSGDIAKERLEQMILAEKLRAEPDVMTQMKREMRAVIRKYVNLDYTRLDIQIRFFEEIKQGEEHVKTIQIKGL